MKHDGKGEEPAISLCSQEAVLQALGAGGWFTPTAPVSFFHRSPDVNLETTPKPHHQGWASDISMRGSEEGVGTGPGVRRPGFRSCLGFSFVR